MPAAIGNRASSPHAVRAIAATANNNEYLGYMTKEPDSYLVLRTRHFPATLGAISTCLDAFIHTTDFFAAHRACLADFGADGAKTTMKMRAAELEIGRCLAELCAVHQETEVFCLDVLPACFEAVDHGGLQADLMAMAASLYTGLHGLFSVSWLIHGILLR